jgi:hydrogenase-4 component B
MTITESLLLLTPGLPLLLAAPWLRRVVPRFEYVAILPALLLLIFAEQTRVDLPWLLLGSGIGFVEQTPLLLSMALLLWLPAAFSLSVRLQRSDGSLSSEITNRRYSTFFLLTLSG